MGAIPITPSKKNYNVYFQVILRKGTVIEGREKLSQGAIKFPQSQIKFPLVGTGFFVKICTRHQFPEVRQLFPDYRQNFPGKNCTGKCCLVTMPSSQQYFPWATTNSQDNISLDNISKGNFVQKSIRKSILME